VIRKSLSLLLKEVTAAGRNFYSVDFLRGIAALSVVVFHFKNFGGGGGDLQRPASALDQVGLLNLLEPVRHHGALAVMVFWAISGFVFMNIYAGERPSGFTFFIRRFARLYPLHLLTLLVVALVQAIAIATIGHSLIYHDNDGWNFMLHLFMASEWGLGHGESFNYPIWSVSAEIMIYAAFWALVRFFPLNLVRLVLIWAVFEAAAITTGSGLIILCGVYFFGGAITYSLFRLWPEGRRDALLSLAAAGLVASCGLGLIGRSVDLPITASLLPAIGCLLLLFVTAEDRSAGRYFRLTRPVGDITYSSYLWHSPLQMLILLGAGWGLWPVDGLFNDIFFVAYLTLVCVLSVFSFKWIERPAQRWLLARFDPAMRSKPLIAAP